MERKGIKIMINKKLERAHGIHRSLHCRCDHLRLAVRTIDNHSLYWNAKQDMEKHKKEVIKLKKRAGYISK